MFCFIVLFFFDGRNDATGISVSQHIRGKTLGDNAFCADHTSFADRDAGQDRDVTAQPDMILDDDRLCLFQALVPPCLIQRMKRCVDGAVGTDETVCADGDRTAVHEIGIVIYESISADPA